jgi:hypothetical protein
MSRLSEAIDQIAFARKYALSFLDTIDPADWFRMPAEGVTHVAWQVGHLAFAHYRLGMWRIRGERPGDDGLMPAAFIAAFKAETMPSADPAAYPPVAEIQGRFDRLHQHLLAELAEFPESELDSPIAIPHKLCKTKIEALRWCAAHEMVHAGQIGLLRRLFGKKPIW